MSRSPLDRTLARMAAWPITRFYASAVAKDTGLPLATVEAYLHTAVQAHRLTQTWEANCPVCAHTVPHVCPGRSRSRRPDVRSVRPVYGFPHARWRTRPPAPWPQATRMMMVVVALGQTRGGSAHNVWSTGAGRRVRSNSRRPNRFTCAVPYGLASALRVNPNGLIPRFSCGDSIRTTRTGGNEYARP